MNTASNEPLNIHESSQRSCWSKQSKCCKCCIGCSICSIITAAVLIPILICVVAPKVAQTILDNTVVSLPNTTLNACSGLRSWVENEAILDIPGPLIGSSTIHPYTQEIWTLVCGEGPNAKGGFACDNPTEALVGTYLAPEMSVSQGKNHKNFSVGMAVNSSNVVIIGLIYPAFFEKHKVPLILKARDITITVAGLSFHGLTMHNEVTCIGAKQLPAVDIPNYACYPDDANHTQFNGEGYYLSCVAGHFNLTRRM